MTGIKPSDHGIVVDHKESGVRYAVSDKNYDERVHRKVRDLRAGETVRGYQPKRLPGSESSEGSSEALSGTTGEEPTVQALEQGSKAVEQDASPSSRKATQTEGSASAGTQE